MKEKRIPDWRVAEIMREMRERVRQYPALLLVPKTEHSWDDFVNEVNAAYDAEFMKERH